MCNLCNSSSQIVKVSIRNNITYICYKCIVELGLDISLTCDICKSNETSYFLYLSLCKSCSQKILNQ